MGIYVKNKVFNIKNYVLIILLLYKDNFTTIVVYKCCISPDNMYFDLVAFYERDPLRMD
jgi:hypothetical protein